MDFIDSHAHVYLPQFHEDKDEIIERSLEQGVAQIFMPNIDKTSIDDMMELEQKYPGVCPAMMGLHPCSVDKDFQQQLYNVENWINSREFAAIGEIGTDLYWDKSHWGQQQEAFRIQLQWAKEKKWPAIIHCRESIKETIAIVEELNTDDLAGIFHCFTGSVEQARKITEMGFYLGIGGVSTFKSGGLEEVIIDTDLKFLVLETDSPYLAPVPYRGKRNEPSYLPIIAKRISEIKDVDIGQVAEVTSANCKQIFSNYAI